VTRLRRDSGYTLIEMLIVMSIMGVVMGGITTLFVTGSNAEVDQNNRFQAQQSARIALDKIRREVHCASSITLSGTVSSGFYPAMTENATGCGGVQYTWCTSAVNASTTRFRLYRITGAWPGSCTGGVQYADYVIRGTLFAYNSTTSGSLPKLTVDLPVNVKPTTKSFETYELKDDVVLRNGTRAP
jgi:prepilin-type N-terminal cleavage/methylation domain-containing protein